MRGIHTDRALRALATALISFAAEIGATIVAEGIETRRDLDALSELGVALGQGFHLGRPADPRSSRSSLSHRLPPMPGWAIAAAVVAALVAIRAAVALVRARRHPVVATARIVTDSEHTEIDERGAVRSVQAAELTLPAAAARRDLDARCTSSGSRARTGASCRAARSGLIRVAYTPDASASSCCCARPFVLLRFQAPEYEMDERRGVVRWRIERGLLVARRGHGGDGYLQIDVARAATPGRRRHGGHCTSRSRSRTSIRRSPRRLSTLRLHRTPSRAST